MHQHDSKLRRQIAWQAARLIHSRQETHWGRARLRAARQLVRGWLPPRDLPQRWEIDEQLRRLVQAVPQSGGPACPSDELSASGDTTDRFAYFASLLYPLENVVPPPQAHPEGDALYHSLQVFELAREELPYDEEFLLAALLHDVGKAVDPRDHVAAALQLLEGYITERTAWLIEHHVTARGCLDGSIGRRARQRLQQHESFDELMTLVACDRAGRRSGVQVGTVEQALQYIAELSHLCEGDGP